MKYILAIGLMFAVTANAGGYKPESNGANALSSSNSSSVSVSGALSKSNAVQNSTVNASGGAVDASNDVSLSNDIDNNTKMPASSAIAPSVATMVDCAISNPSSKAFSVLIFSVSGTTGTTMNPICFALKTGDVEVAKKLMCKESSDYAKANSNFCEVK